MTRYIIEWQNPRTREWLFFGSYNTMAMAQARLMASQKTSTKVSFRMSEVKLLATYLGKGHR